MYGPINTYGPGTATMDGADSARAQARALAEPTASITPALGARDGHGAGIGMPGGGGRGRNDQPCDIDDEMSGPGFGLGGGRGGGRGR